MKQFCYLRMSYLSYRNAQRDRPVFQGLGMSMVMSVCETVVHIGWQYIRLEGIWQEDTALTDYPQTSWEARQ
jgi:hypothetical protein